MSILDEGNQSFMVARILDGVEMVRHDYTRPSVLMKPRVFLDSPGTWCCMYGDCLADSPAGFGDSPMRACADFDRRWWWSQAEIDKADAEKRSAQGGQADGK